MKPQRVCPRSAAAGLGVALGLANIAYAADPLPTFEADLSQTSVSGLSSGAYMAGQFHVAFSGTLIGAAIIAGGPYDCADGSIAFALQRCMDTALGVPDPSKLLAHAREREARTEIDPLANLADDQVYIFSGTEDGTVTPPVVAEVADFYRLAGVPAEKIEFVADLPAGHAIVTEDSGNACNVTGPPFVNDCDYDQAHALLGHIYGELTPPPAIPGGRLIEFDQSEFLPDPTAHGMALTGLAYVPPDCAGSGDCRVHVAFHGCKQTAELVGDAFVQMAGYNRWAESNRLIVLYPQAHQTSRNPNSCWDWWGYDDAAYATRSGRQMAAVRAMLDRLAGNSLPPAQFCAQFEASNLGHWQAGRARTCDLWFVCAVGSGERIGLPVSTTTLFEHPEGNFSTTTCSG